MKKFIKIILISILSLIGLAVLGIVGLLWWMSKIPVVDPDYVEHTERWGEIEKRFGAMGTYDVEFKDFPADSTCGRFDIWTPKGKEGELFPVVIIANGSGTPASKIHPLCRHLASWGFIVAGNEDEHCRSGLSSAQTLDFVLKEFSGQIDVANIGITGHSQGGIGAINGATKHPNSHLYKAIFTISATCPYWAQETTLGTDWSFDATKITIPIFLCAGTGAWDAGTSKSIKDTEGQGICPLWAMQQEVSELPENIPYVIARRIGKDHGEMITEADAYMTAWFCFWLKNDSSANAFFGHESELSRNPNWQDVEMRASKI